MKQISSRQRQPSFHQNKEDKTEQKENMNPNIYFDKYKTQIDLKDENKTLIKNIRQLNVQVYSQKQQFNEQINVLQQANDLQNRCILELVQKTINFFNQDQPENQLDLIDSFKAVLIRNKQDENLILDLQKTQDIMNINSQKQYQTERADINSFKNEKISNIKFKQTKPKSIQFSTPASKKVGENNHDLKKQHLQKFSLRSPTKQNYFMKTQNMRQSYENTFKCTPQKNNKDLSFSYRFQTPLKTQDPIQGNIMASTSRNLKYFDLNTSQQQQDSDSNKILHTKKKSFNLYID